MIVDMRLPKRMWRVTGRHPRTQARETSNYFKEIDARHDLQRLKALGYENPQWYVGEISWTLGPDLELPPFAPDEDLIVGIEESRGEKP